MDGSKSAKLDEITKLRKALDMGLNRIEKKIEKIETRLDGVEYQLENVISPYKKKVTPAMEETLSAIEELAGTHTPAHLVSVPEISQKTKRSIPTEEGYVKYLYDNGILVRQALYAYSRTGRRVRKYGYRIKQ